MTLPPITKASSPEVSLAISNLYAQGRGEMPTRSPLPGAKILLMGDQNAGKTYAIQTLADAGLKVLAIFTENGYKVLGPALRDKISWVFVSPVANDIEGLRAQAKMMREQTQSAIAGTPDISRKQSVAYDTILGSMFKFVDQNGKDWGNISTWGTGTAFVLDSLTGLFEALWRDAVGKRILVGLPDYGIVHAGARALIQMWWTLRCHVVVTAHIEMEIDPIKGGRKIYPSMPGQALRSFIGVDWDEMILAERLDRKFVWTNDEPGAKLKARNVPFGSGMPPSFVPVIEGWKKQGGIIEPV